MAIFTQVLSNTIAGANTKTELNDINGAQVTPTLNATSRLLAIQVTCTSDNSAAASTVAMIRIEGQGVRQPLQLITSAWGATSTSVSSWSTVGDLIPLGVDVVHNSPIQVFGSVSGDTGNAFIAVTLIWSN